MRLIVFLGKFFVVVLMLFLTRALLCDGGLLLMCSLASLALVTLLTSLVLEAKLARSGVGEGSLTPPSVKGEARHS